MKCFYYIVLLVLLACPPALGQTLGRTVTWDSLSLSFGGKRVVPVMGEIHYSRLPEQEWKRELQKMKEGGVTIIANYVFWNHVEEKEGTFNWSGQRSLRRFLEICKEEHLPVVLRIGPFCHGEARGGGIPDWMMEKNVGLRSEDPGFLHYVRILYRQIFMQVQGLQWKDGGPLLACQFDNEFGGDGSYLMTLKRIALETGFDLPFYTRTGWPKLKTPVPHGEMIPLYGDYADGFWDRSIEEGAGTYWRAFNFSAFRAPTAIASEQLKKGNGEMTEGDNRYPYFTCELGGGMITSYHRRVYLYPHDAYSLAIVKLGSGSNLLGYYMYHGGTQPEGDCYLNEMQRTPYTNWNDLPVKSYDYQAPLGEFGQKNPHYYILRKLHLFLHDYGETLAPMKAFFPQAALPFTKGMDTYLRWSYRQEGNSAFVFINNYERFRNLSDKKNVRFNVCGVEFPHRPMTVPGGTSCIFPVNIDGIRYATAQLIARRNGNIYLEQVEGIPVEISIDGKVLKNLRPQGTGRPVYKNIYLLTSEDAGRLFLPREDEKVCRDIPFRKIRNAGTPRKIVLGVAGVAESPEDKDFEQAAVYTIEIPDNKGLLSIGYQGDCARLYADGKLIADNFYNGREFLYGLWRLPAGTRNLELRILPLQPDAPIYFPREADKTPGEKLVSCRVQDEVSSPDIPRHGSYETTPATIWEDGFVSGNGRMGAILYGEPGHEILVANHCRLYLPRGSREIVPDLAQYLPQVRHLFRQNEMKEAQSFLLEKAKEQGFKGIVNTDPFHPGFFVHIRQGSGNGIRNYRRTEDFRTGEVVITYSDDQGCYQRRMFVSREANMIVLSLKGPGNCELEVPGLHQDLIQEKASCSAGWVGMHNIYTQGKGGYDAGIRIIRKGGTARTAGNKILISHADEIVLKMRIVPWKTPLDKEQSEAWAYSPDNPDFDRPGRYIPNPPLAESSQVAYRTVEEAEALLPAIKRALQKENGTYEEMLEKHAALHRELFDRVGFSLHTDSTRQYTTSGLLEEARKTRTLPSALMEKMFDAGKYMFICSAGELPPNLQGVWTGTWNPNWSGDFTLDTNVEAAMASACGLNLLELQEGYFRLMESFYPEWRLNAMRMYGCRGFLTNARASNTALLLHWGMWEGNFWTAGCGWLASLFTRYADYTQDMDFLKRRCLPFLKETALFYEDFLQEDAEGKLMFVPSYNPETGPGINATMDIAVAKEVLTDLIRFSRMTETNGNEIPKWEAMLRKLPPYPINNGTLTEWPHRGMSSKHRHHSQLYPCFQSFDPVFENDMPLRAAAQSTVQLKIDGLDGEQEARGEQSSFSRIQGGTSAAYLGMAEEAYGRLAVMAYKRNMYSNLITSHDPDGRIFNVDGNGGIPQMVITMLAFSRTDSVDLLRALPSAWPDGTIRGVNLACGCLADIEWKQNGLVSATFHATRDTRFMANCKGRKQHFVMKKGETAVWKQE